MQLSRLAQADALRQVAVLRNVLCAVKRQCWAITDARA